MYVLRGDEGDDTRIYVGETLTLINRLNDHASSKDFWTEAVLFIREGDELDKADVLYLEARLIQLAEDAGRSTLDNSDRPDPSKVLGKDKADKIAAAESYLEETLLALQALGFSEFQQTVERKGPSVSEVVGHERDGANDHPLSDTEEPIRVLTCKRGGIEMHARGKRNEDGSFKVLTGSSGLLEDVPSLAGKAFRKVRERRARLLESTNVQKQEDGLFQLSSEIDFDNPSEAEGVMAGRPGSGLALWKPESELEPDNV